MNFKLALCQMLVTDSPEENRERASKMVREAAQNGAAMVALPEMFHTPYSHKNIVANREKADGKTVSMLSSLAKECNIYLIGGSIAEEEEDKIYNTCFAFNPDGVLIGKHRKAHLFDVNVKGGIRFIESDTFTPGNQVTVIETEFCKVGIGICYDVRFPELFRSMALKGAQLMVLPASFNMTTGPAHWDITMRARALDNQVYFAGVSPARNLDSSYHSYGSSCIATPWGEFCAKLDSNPSIAYGNIDLDYLERIRNELPLLKQRKSELYHQ
ncbi:carbon-nitrogen hydrolase family protein [Anaerovorax sp. IOR16]|uniref:carbon-nitrogen hydrolase family protein n=1 Tax=Anaerovorax sp. IOR16 TaxID=2773458 RepID=UPI001FD647C4|nr:carbon-nitrogen hydrolase family protein [Anaerovorax sp. IOR16]